jgi:hypothetical protein
LILTKEHSDFCSESWGFKKELKNLGTILDPSKKNTGFTIEIGILLQHQSGFTKTARQKTGLFPRDFTTMAPGCALGKQSGGSG